MLAVVTGPGTAAAQTAGSDRNALEALYNATDGASWTDSTNWLSDELIGNWHGVTANAYGRVTDLLLADNNLAGALPPELGDLVGLRRPRS